MLALSGVDDNLGKHHFVGVDSARPMLEFMRLNSKDLINNPYLRQDNMTP